MSFQQGLSGLNVSAKALDTIGNNISNSGTVGFKAATTQFADVYAASLSGGGTSQIGIGASMARVSQQFTQGNVTNTSNPLDMAINGSGMYRMSNNGTITYTRSGQFQLDKDGFITSAAGLKLTGYSADPVTGTISPGNLVPLQVLNNNIAPKTTTASQIQLNLDSRATPPSAMTSGSLSGAKALGQATVITQGVNDVLDLVVDGNPVSVTIPPNSTGYTVGGLVTTLQSLINAALAGTGSSVTVSNSASGKLTVTSGSKGSLGANGDGSSVTLSGLGGPAASVLFGAAVQQKTAVPDTAGYLTGGTNVPATAVDLTTGGNFDLTVDGVTKTIAVAAGPHATTDGPPSSLETALQSAIDAQFGPAGTVKVSAASGSPVKITSGTIGVTSSVAISAMDPAIATLMGTSVATAGVGSTAGSLAGGANLADPVTITTDQAFDLTVDGVTKTLTLPTAAYATSDGPPSSLQTALQSAIDTAFGSGKATVSAVNGSPLKITSSTLGTGSSVAMTIPLASTELQAVMGTTVATAGTAPPTVGSIAGGLDLPSAVTIGAGESFSLTVDGVAKTISVPAGTYSTTGAAPSALQKALQDAIDVQFPPAGTVSVAAVFGSPLTISSGSQGANSSVSVGSMSAGVQALFGPSSVAGTDSFNQIAGKTSGTLTGRDALVAPIAITTGVNDIFNVNVDGQTVSVTLTAGSYATPTALATEVQTQINNALAAVIPATSARVTATVNASNKLVVTSNSQGTGSSVTLTGNGGTAATALFGANGPITLAGSQTQSVNTLGFTASTAQTVYDSQGNPHNLALYFVKTSTGNVWQMYTTMDSGQQTGPTELVFNGSGALQTPMPITLPATGSSYTFTSSSTNASAPDPMQFTLDLRGTTQYGVSFGVNTLTQDGYSSGQLSGISVGTDGVIQGRYSNGKSQNMGQIVLVNFNNSNGLKSLGGNQWAETSESGQAIPGAPGSGSLGVIQSAAVEESNVDLTKELVDMITQQRAYQANAQTIKTMDSVLQTLVNLR